MTEADEALLYARKSSVSKTYANIHSLARAYRAGAAASAERIKELEAALQRLVNASEPVEEYTHEVAVELEEAIKTAKSVLKEPDQ